MWINPPAESKLTISVLVLLLQSSKAIATSLSMQPLEGDKDTDHAFLLKQTREKTINPDIHYFTKERVNRFVTLIISFIILVLLVLPIYALYKSSNGPEDVVSNTKCIGILLVATLVFSTVLSLFTKAKRHEILGASAA